MSERSFKNHVLKLLGPLDGRCIVEHPGHIGTPDVNFVDGWMELKFADRWPPRGGVLRLEHFTQQQRVWLLKRHMAGGNVWLLLQVGKEWLLFDGQTASRSVGRVTRRELLRMATRHWPTRPPAREFQRCVSKT